MEIHRNNHFIPQMYLHNWESSKNKIQVYDLLVSNEKVPLWREQSIENTASMKNLYVRVEDGVEFDDFEIDFDRKYENPAKSPFVKICNGKKLTSDEWYILIEYIISQYVRTPSFQQWTYYLGIKKMPPILDEICEETEKMFNGTNDITSIPKLTSSNDNRLIPVSFRIGDDVDEEKVNLEISTIIGKNFWLQTIKMILSENSKVRTLIHDFKWSVVTAYSGITWPTCDNPFIICKSTKDNKLIYTSDYGILDNIILFPLSPTKALLASRKRIFTWNFIADESFSLKIKELIVKNAFLYIYNSVEDNTIIQYRSRTVDEKEYKRIANEYGEWFDKYKEQEGPFLTSQHTYKNKAE